MARKQRSLDQWRMMPIAKGKASRWRPKPRQKVAHRKDVAVMSDIAEEITARIQYTIEELSMAKDEQAIPFRSAMTCIARPRVSRELLRSAGIVGRPSGA
jgi:hypothetical protein